MHSDLRYINIPGGRLSEPGGKEPWSNHGALCIIHSSRSIRLHIKSCSRACSSHGSKRATASSYLMSPLQKVRRRAFSKDSPRETKPVGYVHIHQWVDLFWGIGSHNCGSDWLHLKYIGQASRLESLRVGLKLLSRPQENALFLRKTLILLFRSTDWMSPTHIIKDNLLYLKSPDGGLQPHLQNTSRAATPRVFE